MTDERTIGRTYPAGPPAPLLESKVKWAAAGTFVGLSALVYILELIRDQPVIVSGLPDWCEPLLLSALPTIIALVAGYLAKHTPRPDLHASQR